MSNKLCLYESGHITEPEMCSLWLKSSISYNFYRYSFVIASVGLNIDRVTRTRIRIKHLFKRPSLQVYLDINYKAIYRHKVSRRIFYIQ